MNWIILIFAGLCEVGFTYCLGRAKGVTGSEGPRCRLHGSKVRASWGLGIIAKPLGNISFTLMGMLPITHGRYRNTPITDIGVRNAAHLRQMEALIVMKTDFSR